jgi:serine/threonine protein kinase
MITGHYPFLGDTLQETYDKIVNDPVQIPDNMNPQLADLLERLLCKGSFFKINCFTAL